jgi:hypothetical protein
MKPRRRHYKLNAEVIEKVRCLAEYGAALEHIAPAVGVSYDALRMWIRNAKGNDPTKEEILLLTALNEGRAAGAHKLQHAPKLKASKPQFLPSLKLA